MLPFMHHVLWLMRVIKDTVRTKLKDYNVAKSTKHYLEVNVKIWQRMAIESIRKRRMKHQETFYLKSKLIRIREMNQ